MKKTLLIVLPLLFIMSCEDDKDDAVVAVEELSIIGTWTVESVTEYDNLECMGSGETLNETGSMTFTETSADLSITESVSFEDMCSDFGEDAGYGSDGSAYLPSDTLCQLGYGYIGYWYFDYDDFVYECEEEWLPPGTVDGLTCSATWTEQFDYTYDMETNEYCEVEDGESVCGYAYLTENSLTLLFPHEDDGEEEEGCVRVVLSRE